MQVRVTDSVFSIDELTFNPMGDSFTLTYSAESNWTISAPSWVNVSPSSGRAGTYEITVMATINDSWAERSGEIEVDFHRIQVNQPCPYLRVSYEAMSDSTITVSNIPVTGPGVNEGTITAVYAWNHSDQARRRPLRVNVDSNVPWEMIFEEGSELTFFKVDTLNKGTHSFNPKSEPSRVSFDLMATKNNFQNADMETGFLIRPSLVEGQTRQSLDKAIASYQFDLHQNHLRFLIDGLPDTATAAFDELGYVLDESGSIIPGIFQKSFMVDCEIPWEVLFLDAEGNPFGSNFVKSNIQHGQENSLQLEIPKRCNPSEEQREMIVRLSASDGDATRDIHVIQRPYIFEIDKDGWADTEFDNGELDTGSGPRVHEIPLRTSGSWTVEVLSSDPAWLRVDPNTSGGEASPGKPIEKNIKFWAYSQNLHLKNPAVSYLRFRAQNDQVKDIPITQAPFLLRADYDPDDLNNISATRLNERKELRLTTSNSWKFTQTNGSPLVDSDWYTVDVKQGAGATTNRLIRVGATSQNPSETSPRNFTMLLTSDLHEAMSSAEKNKWGYAPVRISIGQRPFTFKVNGKAAGASNVMTIHAYEPDFTDYLDVDCDAEWRITERPAWIHPNYTSSTTDQDVLLQPDLNLVKSERTGQVKVQCTWGGNTRIITVDIKQEALVFEVSRVDSKSMTDLDPDINFEDHKPTSFGFRVVATDKLPWRLISNYSSFVPPISSMTGSQTVSVYPTYNSNLNDGRTATIRITLDRSADSRITDADESRYSSEYNWAITQKKYEFDTGDVSTTAAFYALGGLKGGKKSYSFSCSGPWEVSYCPSWMHLRSNAQVITGGDSNPNFELVPDPNLELYDRGSSRVTIRSKIGGYTKSITVSQDAYQYKIISGNSIQFETVSPTAATIKFRSSGDWELQGASASDWNFKPASGKGNDNGQVISVTVNPGDYLNINADRRGTVKLVSSYGGQSFSTEEISLFQPKYQFSVNTSSVSFSSPFQKECASQAVSVTCTGDWTATATANDNWVAISNGSGKGNGTFSIGVAKDNLTTNELNAIVTVTTTYKGQKVHETNINVAQSAYVFSLGKISHQFPNSGQGLTEKISISCSGDWVVTKTKDDDDMIASFTPSGKKNGTISITANANSGKSAKDKTATLQVKCENSNNLVQTITLTQKK